MGPRERLFARPHFTLTVLLRAPDAFGDPAAPTLVTLGSSNGFVEVLQFVPVILVVLRVTQQFT